MEKISKIVNDYLPGLAIVIIIATIAFIIEMILPIHFIGASVIALFIGLILNNFIKIKPIKKGLDFASKRLLKIAIIILGASLSLDVILSTGKESLIVMVFTLFTCFIIGYFVGRLFKLNWRLSSLINAGTGICGGSAIAAISPVIKAKENYIAIAMSATFIFDMLMIIIFPILGKEFGMTDLEFGLWAGTAINDTSSVVAAAGSYSEAALEFATAVKLTRTLSIVPIVIIFHFINVFATKKETASVNLTNDNVTKKKDKINYKKVIPWFIVGFLLMVILNSIGLIPEGLSDGSKEISKYLMIIALAAIGLKTSFKEVKVSGIRPMLHGFVVSALVVIVAYFAIMYL